jgi:hypothetical protein
VNRGLLVAQKEALKASSKFVKFGVGRQGAMPEGGSVFG